MSWRIRLREKEQCGEQPFLSPDIVIKVAADYAYADLAIADPVETMNRGGLRSREALQTAVLIQLFSDARARDEDVLPDMLDPDRRGWWGDSVGRVPEQGQANIGSRLWLLRRSPLTPDTAVIAAEMVHEALQPIVDQGAVSHFEVETESSYMRLATSAPETGVLAIAVRGYDTDGQRSYDQRFEVLWDQVRDMRGTRKAFAL